MKNIRETMPRLHSAIVSYFSGVASRLPEEKRDDQNTIMQLAKKGKYDLAHLLCVRDNVAPKQYRGYDYFPVKLFSQNIEQRIDAVENKQQGEKYLKKSLGIDAHQLTKDITEALNNEENRLRAKAYVNRTSEETPDFLYPTLEKHGIVGLFGGDRKKALDSIVPYITKKARSVYEGDNASRNEIDPVEIMRYLRKVTTPAVTPAGPVESSTSVETPAAPVEAPAGPSVETPAVPVVPPAVPVVPPAVPVVPPATETDVPPAVPVETPATETDVPPATDIKSLPDLGLAIHYLATDEDEGTEEKHQIREQVSTILQNSGISFKQRQAIIKSGKINTEHADAIRNHLASLSSASTSTGDGPGAGAGDGPGDGPDTAEAARRTAEEAAERTTREAAERTAREAAERTAREAAERTAREEAERTAREEAERTAREEAERTAREEAARTAAPASPSGEYAHKDYSYYTKMTFDDFRRYIRKIYTERDGATLNELQHIEEVFGLGDKTSSDPDTKHPLFSQPRLSAMALAGIFITGDHIRKFAPATPSRRRDPAETEESTGTEEAEIPSEGTTRTAADALAAKFSFAKDPLPSYVTKKGMNVDAELAKIKKDYDTRISGLSTASASDAEKIKAKTEAALKVKKLLGWQETADEAGVNILNPSVATKLHLPEHRELASIIDADSILTKKKPATTSGGSGGYKPTIGDLALAQSGTWDADALKGHAAEAVARLPDYQIKNRLLHMFNKTGRFDNIHADQITSINSLLAEARTRNLSEIIPMRVDSLGTAGAVRRNRMTSEQHAELNKKMNDYISGGAAVTANPSASIRAGTPSLASQHAVVGQFNNYSVSSNGTIGPGSGGARTGTGPTRADLSLGLSVGQFKRIFPDIFTGTHGISLNSETDILRAPRNNDISKNIRMLYIIATNMKMAGAKNSEIAQFIKRDSRTYFPTFDESLIKKGGKVFAAAMSGAMVAKKISNTTAFSRIDIAPELKTSNSFIGKYIELHKDELGNYLHNEELNPLTKIDDGKKITAGLESIKDFFPKSLSTYDLIRSHPHPGADTSEIKIDPATKMGTSDAISQYHVPSASAPSPTTEIRKVNFYNHVENLHPAIRDHFFTLLDQINAPALQAMKRLNHLSPDKSIKKRGPYEAAITEAKLEKAKKDILNGDYQSAYDFFSTLSYRARQAELGTIADKIDSSLKAFHAPERSARLVGNPFDSKRTTTTTPYGFRVAAQNFIKNAKDQEGNYVFNESMRNDTNKDFDGKFDQDQFVGKTSSHIQATQGIQYLVRHFWGNPADHDKKDTEDVIAPAQFSTALAEDHSLNAWQRILHDQNRKIGITLNGGVPVRAGRINNDSEIKLTFPRIDRRPLDARGSRAPIIEVKRHVFDMIHPALEAAVYAHGPWSEATDQEKDAHVEKLKELGRLFGKDGEDTFTSIIDAKPIEHDKLTKKLDGTSGPPELHVGEDGDGTPVPIKDSAGNDMTVKDTKFEFDDGHPWKGYQLGWLREQNGSPNGPKSQILPSTGFGRSTRSNNAKFLAGKVKDSVPMFETISSGTTYLTDEARALHNHVHENLGKKADDTDGKLKYLLKDGIATPEETLDTPCIDMHGRVDTTFASPTEIQRPQLALHPVAGKTHADIVLDPIKRPPTATTPLRVIRSMSFSIPTLAFALRKSKESIALKKALMYAKLHRNVERAFGSKKAREGTFLYGR